MNVDERISAELRRHAPEVDERAAWDRIRSAVPVGRRSRMIRLVAVPVAAAGLLLVASILIPTLFSGPAPAGAPEHPFVGTWVTMDDDGSTPTMTIEVSTEGAVEIVVVDDFASVCFGAPSTLTGTGRLEGNTELVIPTPVLTCDDGSQPEALSGPPLEELLRNLTLALDPQSDTLTDNLGSTWTREGSEGPGPEPATGWWPQSSLEEVQEAQRLADAGDPAFTWQVDPQLVKDDSWTMEEPGQVELVDRFIREVLGWEAYMLNSREGMARDGSYDVFYDQRYLRCAPGRTNPLYPPGPEPEWGELCAPTLDDLRYESVSIDLAQLDRQGPDGIWVVNRWGMTAPFAQADPVAVEARATQRLEEFLTARIAGQGAEGHVQVYSGNFGRDIGFDVPLLYATTSGDPYERYEIERVDRPKWPDASMTFSVRLFADGGATVVEHQISWEPCCGGLWLYAPATTENGQPVTVSYTSSDGEVTVSAPGPWETWSGGGTTHDYAPGVWFWELYSGEDRIEFTDPVAYDSWCAAHGGSPLLSAPAGAAQIAQEVIADPNFEATAPVAARVGGAEAVSIDVALAPGGEACGIGIIVISRWIHVLWQPGLRMRLYLVDLPEGMSVQTLAITVVATEERFEEVIAETAPIIQSIEFHTG